MCSFVRNELPFLTALEFPGLPGLVLGQPRNLIGQISSFVMGSGWSAARRQGLPPFAFPQGSVLQMQIFCCVAWAWVAPARGLPTLREFALEVELLAWKLPVLFHEQRSPPACGPGRRE